MAKPTILFEHEYTTGFNWSDGELVLLERLNKAVGTEILRPAIHRGRRELKAGSHVGIVRFGARTIQVLPKIHKSSVSASEQERAREATRNLLYMLAYAGHLSIREHTLAPMFRQGSDWFEILTRLFASHLLEEWQRGAYRNYQSIEDDLPVLKCKWRIADQLRRPMRQHIFSVAYDEFTADNALNRTFRFVVERLWRLTRDNGNRQILGELRQWMEEVTLLARVSVAEATPSLLTRLNGRYAPLLNLARLFLDGGALQLSAGDLSSFAFTFDMNQLFETFLINFIRRHREEILPSTLRESELLSQSRGVTYYLARRENRGVFHLKPDLAFSRMKQFPLLLDAKYKRLNQADAKLGVSQADFYQMHAYAHRYACQRVILIYPQTTEMPEPLRAQFVVEGAQITIDAVTVNLQVALESRNGRSQLIHELKYLLQMDD